MKKQIQILATIILSFYAFSCGDGSDNNDTCCHGSSIVDLASQTESLSTMVSALQITGLDQTLSAPGSFTVLAPSNDAFDTFLSTINVSSLEDIPVDVLTNVLLNHVIIGEVQSASLTNGYASTLAESNASGNNMSIYVNTDNGVKFNGVSDVTTPDVSASNGIIHIVDAVIDLPSVVTFAIADPNFGILVQALTRPDLTESYVAMLSTPAGSEPSPFTIFAPVNSAFENLLNELGLNSLEEIDEPTLSSVLSYHVVLSTNQLSANFSGGMEFTTSIGENLIFNFSDTGDGVLTDNNERTSNIIKLDIQANNGIIHAIDTVVLP